MMEYRKPVLDRKWRTRKTIGMAPIFPYPRSNLYGIHKGASQLVVGNFPATKYTKTPDIS